MEYHASHMATKTSKLMAHHLKYLIALVKVNKKHTPTLLFNTVKKPGDFSLEVYSDAAMSNKNDNDGRFGFIIFRRHGDFVHPIYWNARKLRRVARSSITAEILAAADDVCMILYLQKLLSEITYHHCAELVVDSRSTFKLASSTKEPAESFNKVDLATIREVYTPKLLKTVSWCPGYYLVADALTKDNRTSSEHLLKTLREGIYPHHPNMQRLDSNRGYISIGNADTNSVRIAAKEGVENM